LNLKIVSAFSQNTTINRSLLLRFIRHLDILLIDDWSELTNDPIYQDRSFISLILAIQSPIYEIQMDNASRFVSILCQPEYRNLLTILFDQVYKLLEVPKNEIMSGLKGLFSMIIETTFLPNSYLIKVLCDGNDTLYFYAPDARDTAYYLLIKSLFDSNNLSTKDAEDSFLAINKEFQKGNGIYGRNNIDIIITQLILSNKLSTHHLSFIHSNPNGHFSSSITAEAKKKLDEISQNN